MSARNKEARSHQPPPHTKDSNRARGKGECNQCLKTKPLTEFHKNGTGQKFPANDPRRYRPTCAECIRVTSACKGDSKFKPDRRGKRNKGGRPRIYQDAAQLKRHVRRKTRVACLYYLAKAGCETCGEHDPRVLEFDHKDPTKKRETIARLISQGYAWSSEILRREIRKCRILCANCHRKHTIQQQDYYSHPDVRGALQEIYDTYEISGGV